MYSVQRFLLLLSFSHLCQSARILGVIPTPSYSHQVVFQPLWKELSLRGHQVTVLTTNPINDLSLTNLTEVDLSFSYKFLEENLAEIITSSQNVMKSYELTMRAFSNVVDAQMRHPQVQDLIHGDEHFDLLIVEYFLVAPIYFHKKFSCPYIGVLSIDAPSSMYRHIGSTGHPIVYPNQFMQIHRNPSILQRVWLILMEIYGLWVSDFHQMQEVIAKNHFQDDTSAKELLQNVSLLFVNSDPVFHFAKPLLPSIIPIGGNIARISVKPLQKNVKQYLDEAREGFIYFSLGSNVKGKDIPARTMNVVLETFRELPYKILWKYELSDLSNKPHNVMITQWVPQMEVLAHPNLKLFITHGGAQSMEETIRARVPVVGMPFFVDQPFNIEKMVSMGFALSVDYREMSKNDFKNAILEVSRTEKYRNRIKELADLIEDQPMTGLERAVWWSEYVIRHKGASHFRSAALDIPWYQYYLLDVIATLVIFTIVLLCLIVMLVKIVIRLRSGAIARPKLKRS